MSIRALLFVLLCSTALAQTQYGTAKPSPGAKDVRPQSVCPWLTQGNAAWALGGDVSVIVNVLNTGEGSCRFSRLQQSGDFLEVLVSKTPPPPCASGSIPLKGIGNEATRCRFSSSDEEIVEKVNSRVRDLYFIVTLSSHKQNRTEKSSDPHVDSLEQIAEQIAGNLY